MKNMSKKNFILIIVFCCCLIIKSGASIAKEYTYDDVTADILISLGLDLATGDGEYPQDFRKALWFLSLVVGFSPHSCDVSHTMPWDILLKIKFLPLLPDKSGVIIWEMPQTKSLSEGCLDILGAG